MTSIQASIDLTDNISGTFKRIADNMTGVISQMGQLDNLTATGPDPSGLINAVDKIAEIETQVDQSKKAIDGATKAQEKMTREMEATSRAGEKLIGVARGILGAFGGLKGIVNSLIETSSEMTQITARLDNINDGAQTTDELVQMIYKSAGQSRAEFITTADAVAKLKNNTGDLFKTTKEVVGFTELLNKTFTASGTSAQEVRSVMLQLGQAMSMNNLRAQEYNSIMAGAPKIIDYIGQYMNVPIDQVKVLAGEGKITAEVIKNAMFLATEDINAQFENIPLTFENIKTEMSNQFLQIFAPVWEELEKFANSPEMQEALIPITQALTVLAGIIVKILSVFASVFNVTMKYWKVAGPILLSLVAIVGAYSMAIMISAMRTKMANGAEIIRGAITAVNTRLTKIASMEITKKSLADGIGTIATRIHTTAVKAFGRAMQIAQLPLIKFILLLTAPIAIIILVIKAYNALTGESVSAMGVIVGALKVAVTFIYNLLTPLINFVIGIVEVFANLFNDPVYAIKKLFVGLSTSIIDVMISIVRPISDIATKIVNLFLAGINTILSSLSNVYNSFGDILRKIGIESKRIDLVVAYNPDTSAIDKLENIKANTLLQLGPEPEGYKNFDQYKKAPKDLGEAWDSGYASGEAIGAKLEGLFSLQQQADDITNGEFMDYGDYMIEDLDSIAGSVDSMDKNLAYLIDVSKRGADTRNTNISINVPVTMTGTGGGPGGLRGDVDYMADALASKIGEAVKSSARGMHI